MLEIIILSSLAAVSGIITATRIVRFRTLLKHHLTSDLLFTFALLALFGGTLSGALVVAFAGLMFSVTLMVARASIKATETAKKYI